MGSIRDLIPVNKVERDLPLTLGFPMHPISSPPYMSPQQARTLCRHVEWKKKLKWSPRRLEKIFLHNISVKGIVSKVCKSLLGLINKRQVNLEISTNEERLLERWLTLWRCLPSHLITQVQSRDPHGGKRTDSHKMSSVLHTLTTSHKLPHAYTYTPIHTK